MKSDNIIIVGGGAAGMAAACAAGKNVILIEKNDRVGRKLLSTGNGRCNFSNIDISEKHYHSPCIEHVKAVLSACPDCEIQTFFSRIGLQTVIESGRLYPYSQTASSVLDILRLEMERLGVRIATGYNVLSVGYRSGRFTVSGNAGSEVFSSCKLIVTTGGKAASHTGSDGYGCELMAGLGHTVTALYPVLTPLTANHVSLKMLKGIRVKPCKLTITMGTKFDKIIAEDTGELLFTDYGLSGVAAMQVSGCVRDMPGAYAAHLDLMPNIMEDKLFTLLKERQALLSSHEAAHFLTGWFHKQVAEAVMREARIEDRQKRYVWDLRDGELSLLCGVLKNWTIPLTGTKGFSSAQGTGGGVSLEEFNPSTMESKIVPGLYAAGEILDVYGDCGGYNLHWAWTTGYLAGHGAADREGQRISF